MSNTPIVTAAIWLSSMLRHGNFSAPLPIAYRIQASFLTLILIYGGVLDGNVMAWSLFHPDWFLTHYWLPSAVFPAGVSIVVGIVSLLAGIFGLFVGLQICQRKLQGFDWAMRCAPFFLLIGVLELARIIGKPSIQNHSGDDPTVSTHGIFVRDVGTHVLQNHAGEVQRIASPQAAVFAIFVVATIMIAFYFWLYRFAKSPKNRQFIIQDSQLAQQPPN